MREVVPPSLQVVTLTEHMKKQLERCEEEHRSLLADVEKHVFNSSGGILIMKMIDANMVPVASVPLAPTVHHV